MVSKPPESLKSLNIYLKTAAEHDKRDPVIAYYCRLYSVQKGMEIDKKSPDAKSFLMGLMDQLDSQKQQLKNNDSVSSETVGQAHVEEYALKLFSFADKKDRAGDFGPATVKSFYTSGILMDILSVFGEVNEDIEKCRKYAKWKALYINQCHKDGETPHAGPLNEEGAAEAPNMSFLDEFNQPTPSVNSAPHQPPAPHFPSSSGASSYPSPAPKVTPTSFNTPSPVPPSSSVPAGGGGGATGSTQLGINEYARAEKLCKFAISSIQYQDTPTAIDYLNKCLKLLSTGKEN